MGEQLNLKQQVQWWYINCNQQLGNAAIQSSIASNDLDAIAAIATQMCTLLLWWLRCAVVLSLLLALFHPGTVVLCKLCDINSSQWLMDRLCSPDSRGAVYVLSLSSYAQQYSAVDYLQARLLTSWLLCSACYGLPVLPGDSEGAAKLQPLGTAGLPPTGQ